MAQFSITVNATNACGGSNTTVGPYPLSAGSILQNGVCPLPFISRGLSPSQATVNQLYSATFQLGNVTSTPTAIGLPPGVSITSFDPVSGEGVISGTPTSSGSYSVAVSASNVCGGGNQTGVSPNLVIGSIIVGSSVGGSIPPDESNRYYASTYVIGSSSTAGFIFKTDGTTIKSSGTQSASTPNWYLTTTPGIGSSFWIRAEIISDIGNSGSNVGTFDTWIPLSVDRTFSFACPRVGPESGRFLNVRFMISNSSSGTPLLATWYNCYVDVENAAAPGGGGFEP